MKYIINKIEKNEIEREIVYRKEVKEKNCRSYYCKNISIFSLYVRICFYKRKDLNLINLDMDEYKLDENSRIIALSILEEK